MEHYGTKTATTGCFGAVIGACRLLQLTETQKYHALGIASTMASGLKSQFGTMGKPLNAGIAASNGVKATKQGLILSLIQMGLAVHRALSRHIRQKKHIYLFMMRC